jgi:hypothetical protein
MNYAPGKKHWRAPSDVLRYLATSGDARIIYQRTNGPRPGSAASRLTENWIGPFVVTADSGHKNYSIQHIDAGTTARHGIHNLCASHHQNYSRENIKNVLLTIIMRRKGPPSTTSIAANDMVLVKTLRGICLAKAWQILDDATIHVHWWNGTHGRLQWVYAPISPAHGMGLLGLLGNPNGADLAKPTTT